MKTYIYILSLPVFLIITNCGEKTKKGEDQAREIEEKRIRVIKKEDQVDIIIDGSIFTSYIYPESIKKPVLFPVSTSSGIAVTRGFPLDPKPWERVDHPHHVGIWLNHGDVNDLDFWNNSDSIPLDRKMHYGTIYHRSVKRTRNGDDRGYLEVATSWKRPDGRELIEENTKFYFSGSDQVRIIDRVTSLTAGDLNVLFKDSKEGMLAIRVIRELEQPANGNLNLLDENWEIVQVDPGEEDLSTGLYESSEGLTGDAVWGTRARWVKLGGDYEGKPLGVVIMDHPENPNHPAHWHARGYGLFAVNPFGSKAYTDGRETFNFFLAQGETIILKYRIYIYEGFDPGPERINRVYEDFVTLQLP
jgi:hypothetical protein